MDETEKPRDRATGQYVHELEQLCTCGHSLGVHLAESARGLRPCINHEVGDGTDCACERYERAGSTVHAMRRIVRVGFVQLGAGYRRGGVRTYYWVVELACGHGRNVTSTGPEPHGVRRCRACAYPNDGAELERSKRALGVLASLAEP